MFGWVTWVPAFAGMTAFGEGTTGKFSAGPDLILAIFHCMSDPEVDLQRLAELVSGGNVVVLSGAGLSTESGIPDYRGPEGKQRITPMMYQDFVATAANRQRY